MSKDTEAPVKERVMRPGPKGGMLMVGNPGNSGGGRPTSAIRRKHKESHEKWLDRMNALLDKEDIADRTIIEAVNTTGKYSMGEVKNVTLEDDAVLRIVEDTINEMIESGAMTVSIGWDFHQRFLENVKLGG